MGEEGRIKVWMSVNNGSDLNEKSTNELLDSSMIMNILVLSIDNY